MITCDASPWKRCTELAAGVGALHSERIGQRRALFLDRDGVMNEEVGYLHRFEDVRFVAGIVPLLKAANRLGWFVCVVTNQAGIGRGLYSEAQFQELMREMRTALLEQGARVDAVYFSPFHPEHGIGEYRRETDCRKPGPGMLLRAAREHLLDLRQSIMIGDRCSDMLAGAAAGVPELYLVGNLESHGCPEPVCIRIESLAQVTERILSSVDRTS